MDDFLIDCKHIKDKKRKDIRILVTMTTYFTFIFGLVMEQSNQMTSAEVEPPSKRPRIEV
jgi:hypothetical protein